MHILHRRSFTHLTITCLHKVQHYHLYNSYCYYYYHLHHHHRFNGRSARDNRRAVVLALSSSSRRASLRILDRRILQLPSSQCHSTRGKTQSTDPNQRPELIPSSSITELLNEPTSLPLHWLSNASSPAQSLNINLQDVLVSSKLHT